MRRVLSVLALVVGVSGSASAEELWTLDFTFRAPRKVVVNVPGEGAKTVWYMVYKVRNRSGAARRFHPRFTLETDTGKIYQDTMLPSAEAVIAKREGSSLRLMNSVEMAKAPIPPTTDADSKESHGIACWVDVDAKTKSFSIFANGLTNAYARVADPKSKKESVRRKALKADFHIPRGEKLVRLSSAIQWRYR